MPRSGNPDDYRRSSEPEDPNFRGQQDSRRSGNGRRIQDLADPLKWIGLALLGTYVATVIAAALPVKLLDPTWINRICGSLRGGVSFPLEGMALIMIGAYLQRTGKEPPMVTDFRRLCSLVALGFVLMIPLQSWAGQKLTDLAVQNQQARIEPAQKANFAASPLSKLSFTIPAGAATLGATITARIQYQDAAETQLLTSGGNFFATGDGGGAGVPGPLPLLGAGAAFGFSRSMRRRIAQSV